jgi:hypothetical protein
MQFTLSHQIFADAKKIDKEVVIFRLCQASKQGGRTVTCFL